MGGRTAWREEERKGEERPSEGLWRELSMEQGQGGEGVGKGILGRRAVGSLHSLLLLIQLKC
jgi:hypothetical protein